MNTLVRLRGFVLDAHILEMKRIQKYRIPTIEEIKNHVRHGRHKDALTHFSRYEVTLVPENVNDLFEIDYRLRDKNSVKYPCQFGFQFDIDDNEVTFQTVKVPRVTGELTKVESDEDFKGKFVQVVGHIQTPPMKDPFISFHIVDPAYKTLDGFNPLYGGIDDYIKYGRRNNYTEKKKLQMKGKWDPSWDTSKQEEEWS